MGSVSDWAKQKYAHTAGALAERLSAGKKGFCGYLAIEFKKHMKTKITTFIIAALATCAASAAEVKPYSPDVCIVSGNKLGSMGTPVTIVHNGQEVKFCCKPCVAKFNKDPEKYLKKIAPKDETSKEEAPKKEAPKK
ncbi:MAG: hypothetical protein NTU84_05605 [Verrucomicrobia bacterium]|nr:hypothetical protein [Verrucomicrobiota bacterium]